MELKTYFEGFYNHLLKKYSEYLAGKQRIAPNTKEYYLQKLMLHRRETINIVNIVEPRKLQIGSEQYIELPKGATCLVFRESWREEVAIRPRDFSVMEDIMYELQSKHILNISEYFFIRGDDYQAFFLDEGIDELDPEKLAQRVFASQLKSAELSEKRYDEKSFRDIQNIGFPESETKEFKQQFPEKAIDVAKELIAFANAKGGNIYFGVDDDGFILGVENPVDLQLRVCGVARNNCEPELNPSFRIEEHGGKKILIATVDESRYVHRRSDGRFYVRVGPSCVEMSVHELEELIIERRKKRQG